MTWSVKEDGGVIVTDTMHKLPNEVVKQAVCGYKGLAYESWRPATEEEKARMRGCGRCVRIFGAKPA